jgi:hypothetical protein
LGIPIDFNEFLLRQINERLHWFLSNFAAHRLLDNYRLVARALVGLVHPMQNPQGELHLIISQEELANLSAVMPRAMLEADAIKGTLVALNLKEHLRANQLGLIYREDRPLTRVAQIFVTLTRRAAAHLVKDGA